MVGIVKASAAYLIVRDTVADVLEDAIAEGSELDFIKTYRVASQFEVEGEFPQVWVSTEGATQNTDLRTNVNRYFTLNLNVVVAYAIKDLNEGESKVAETLLKVWDTLEEGLMDVDFIRQVDLIDFNPSAVEDDEEIVAATMSVSVLYITK